MKKCVAGILAIVLCIMTFSVSFAVGFTQDADAIEKAAKSVLILYVYTNKNHKEPDASGSGFVAFDRTTLITNYHVIEDAVKIIAKDDDDRQYTIETVLCADKKHDIAILEFKEATFLRPLELMPDDQLKRGSPVIAIGSPKGMKNTVSNGIISNQLEMDGVPMIQTNAPLSPGSSGGALLNDNGQVIGVTSMVFKSIDNSGRATNAQNMNFAVNISVAQAMYNAWNGKKYSLKKHKSSAKMDFTDVYKHDKQPSVELQAATPEPAEEKNNEVWVCLNCGKENNTKFCMECGEEKPYWTCSCGIQYSSNRFCGNCGKSFADLIDIFNAAMTDVSNNEYQKALHAVEGLGFFNSGSFDTSKGKNCVAADYINEIKYQWGLYLLECKEYDQCREKMTALGEYKDAQTIVLKAYYEEASDKLASEEYDSAIILYKKADDYLDAKEKLIDANIRQIDKKYGAEGDIDAIISLEDCDNLCIRIKELQEYQQDEKAAGLIKRLNYLVGKYFVDHFDYDNAMIYLQSAEENEYTTSTIKQAKVKKFESDIKKGLYKDALEFYKQELVPLGYNQEYVVVNVRDQGDNVAAIMEIARAIGYDKEIPENEDLYKEEYFNYIVQMEQYFGMDSDGNISLSEFVSIQDTIYPGCEGARVENLMEHLADLGYIDNLPDKHTQYIEKYIEGVKAAEDKLGLQCDGYITCEEYDTIVKKKIQAPKAPSSIKAKANKDTVTLSWSAVKGAVFYEVECDGEVIATTRETSLTHKKVGPPGDTKIYNVIARKYTVAGPEKTKTVNIPEYENIVTAKELNKKRKSLIDSYIVMNGLRIKDWAITTFDGERIISENEINEDNEDFCLLMLCYSDGKYVQVLDDTGYSIDYIKKTMKKMGNIELRIKGIVISQTRNWKNAKKVPTVRTYFIEWSFE